VPVVTALKPTRSSGRLAVHIDGRYAFAASASFIARQGVHEGRVYDAGDLGLLLEAARAESVLADAYRLLNHRARSRAELRERLLRKRHDASQVEAALTHLTAERLLDDDAFAAAFVADKVRLSGWGRERIVRELVAHGLTAQQADEAAASLTAEAEAARALAALRRQGAPRPPLERAKKRALDHLLRRGFAGPIAYQAVSEWSAVHGPPD